MLDEKSRLSFVEWRHRIGIDVPDYEDPQQRAEADPEDRTDRPGEQQSEPEPPQEVALHSDESYPKTTLLAGSDAFVRSADFSPYCSQLERGEEYGLKPALRTKIAIQRRSDL